MTRRKSDNLLPGLRGQCLAWLAQRRWPFVLFHRVGLGRVFSRQVGVGLRWSS